MPVPPAVTSATRPWRSRGICNRDVTPSALQPRYCPSMAVRAEPIDRLRDDVRLLGELVGGVLREQGGAELFEAVEHIRTRRSTCAAATDSDEALHRLDRAPVDRAAAATGARLQRVLPPDQPGRAAASRAHAARAPAAKLRAIARIGRRGHCRADLGWACRCETVQDVLRKVQVHPVLTAHPSEARRRTLLHHLEEAARLIERLDDDRAPPSERSAVLEALRARTTLIWQTAEARVERPSVLDEVQSVLYVLAGTRVRRAATGPSRACRPRAPNPRLRFGSWVGGDRDGNPNVTPDVTRAAARLARAAVLRRYREDVQSLGRDLSISGRLVGCSDDAARVDRARSRRSWTCARCRSGRTSRIDASSG